MLVLPAYLSSILSSVGDTVVIGEWIFAPATLRCREHVTTEGLGRCASPSRQRSERRGEVELWGSGA